MVERASPDEIQATCELLKAVASPVRLAVILELAEAPRRVQDSGQSLLLRARWIQEPGEEAVRQGALEPPEQAIGSVAGGVQYRMLPTIGQRRVSRERRPAHPDAR